MTKIVDNRSIYMCLLERSSDINNNGIYVYLSEETTGAIKISGISLENFNYEDKTGRRNVGTKFRREFPNREEALHYIRMFSVMNNSTVNTSRILSDGLTLKRTLSLEKEVEPH